ncbi:MAG: hypothetical protein JOZ87_10575 [Chloroflexi bacterium]|nr:hypothetical protein [Chloroflexota bacterium]
MNRVEEGAERIYAILERIPASQLSPDEIEELRELQRVLSATLKLTGSTV